MLFFGSKVSSIHFFEIFSVLLHKCTIYFVLSSSIYRCNVSLRGNGLKVLTANSYIPSDTAVIECRGKYMLNNPGLNKVIRLLFYIIHFQYFWSRRAEAIHMYCNTGWAQTWRSLWTGQLMEMTAGETFQLKVFLPEVISSCLGFVGERVQALGRATR